MDSRYPAARAWQALPPHQAWYAANAFDPRSSSSEAHDHSGPDQTRGYHGRPVSEGFLWQMILCQWGKSPGAGSGPSLRSCVAPAEVANAPKLGRTRGVVPICGGDVDRVTFPPRYS